MNPTPSPTTTVCVCTHKERRDLGRRGMSGPSPPPAHLHHVAERFLLTDGWFGNKGSRRQQNVSFFSQILNQNRTLLIVVVMNVNE